MSTVDGQSIAAASWGDNKPHWNLVGNGGLVSTATEFIQFSPSANGWTDYFEAVGRACTHSPTFLKDQKAIVIMDMVSLCSQLQELEPDLYCGTMAVVMNIPRNGMIS